MEPYKCEKNRCWSNTTPLFNLSEDKGRHKNPVGSYIRISTYHASDAPSCEAVSDINESVGPGMGDDEEEDAADEIGAGDIECIYGHRKRKEEVIYDISDILAMFRGHRENITAGQLLRIPHDKCLKLSRIRETIRKFKD